MGIAELEQKEDHPLRPPLPGQTNQVFRPDVEAPVLGRADDPCEEPLGDGLNRVGPLVDKAAEIPGTRAEVVPDDHTPGLLDHGIDVGMVADAAGKDNPLRRRTYGRRPGAPLLQLRGDLLEKRGGTGAVHDHGGPCEAVQVASPEYPRSVAPELVDPGQGPADAVAQDNGRLQVVIGDHHPKFRREFRPEPSQNIDHVLPGAVRVQLDRQDQVEVEGIPDVEAPDIGEPLNRVAGVGKNHPVQEVQATAEGVLQGAPDQGTAVGLKVGLGQADLLSGSEEPHGVRPGGEDDLLRGIGTIITDNLPPAFPLERSRVPVGIGQNPATLIDLLHPFLSLSVATTHPIKGRLLHHGCYGIFPGVIGRKIIARVTSRCTPRMSLWTEYSQAERN